MASKPASMRDTMPETADFVDRKRVEWGRAHVDDCLRRAVKGEPGFFFALERGHRLGTPWTGAEAAQLLGAGVAAARGDLAGVAALQAVAVAIGADAAFFMREPAATGAGGIGGAGGVHGKA